LGAEHRRNSYALLPGDAASRYKAGSQSFPGFALTDAGRHSRTNDAAYVDVNLAPGHGLTIDLASRFEHYSDFGSTLIGKISARKALSDVLALRGTASTGFRAPTLAESYYSATNVQPNSAFVQLPPNAPAAALIGIEPLAPERSRNFSVGAVASPASGLSLTVDAYQIAIRDRIVGSGTLYGTFAGELRSEAVNQAIIANGNILEDVPFTGVNLFTNGLDTRTRGVDVVGNFRTSLGGLGSIQWSLSGSYSKTKVTRIRGTTPQIGASGQSLFDPVAISTLETASPRFKAVLSGLYRSGFWTITAKERFYGNASNFQDPGDGNYYRDSTGTVFITDLEVTRALFKNLSVTAGAINLFDKRPNRVNAEALAVAGAAGSPAVEIYPKFSAFGINGGYYYARARVSFP
jgi:iron complex outermembrane receptor protein